MRPCVYSDVSYGQSQKKKKYVRVTDEEVTLWTKDSIKIFSDSIQGYREIYDVMLQELMIYGH